MGSLGNIKRRVVTIYALCGPVSKKVRYIGKTSRSPQTRLCEHICGARNGRHDRPQATWCANWISSLLGNGKKPLLLVLEECVKDWVAREQFWIRKYKRQGARLTNATAGGEGISGRRQTPEERKKHSLAMIRFFKENPEARKQLSESLMGHAISEEARKKIGDAHRGRELTPTHRKNISVGLLSSPNRQVSMATRKKLSKSLQGHKVSEATVKKLCRSQRARRRKERLALRAA